MIFQILFAVRVDPLQSNRCMFRRLTMLSQNILSAMENRRLGSAVVVAAVDANGGPHTAPFGSICLSLRRYEVRPQPRT